jgi:hypothetical protein
MKTLQCLVSLEYIFECAGLLTFLWVGFHAARPGKRWTQATSDEQCHGYQCVWAGEVGRWRGTRFLGSFSSALLPNHSCGFHCRQLSGDFVFAVDGGCLDPFTKQRRYFGPRAAAEYGKDIPLGDYRECSFTAAGREEAR